MHKTSYTYVHTYGWNDKYRCANVVADTNVYDSTGLLLLVIVAFKYLRRMHDYVQKSCAGVIDGVWWKIWWLIDFDNESWQLFEKRVTFRLRRSFLRIGVWGGIVVRIFEYINQFISDLRSSWKLPFLVYISFLLVYLHVLQ